MEDLHPEVKPLTKKEQAWIDRLERVHENPPTKRLACFTIGDASLTFFDDTIAKKYDFELRDGKAERAGIVLANIRTAMNIHGVSG